VLPHNMAAFHCGVGGLAKRNQEVDDARLKDSTMQRHLRGIRMPGRAPVQLPSLSDERW